MRTFIFNWFKYNRYDKIAQRKSTIKAFNLPSAISAFVREFGNAHKNCITSVQELDGNGNIINSFSLNQKDYSIVRDGDMTV